MIDVVEMKDSPILVTGPRPSVERRFKALGRDGDGQPAFITEHEAREAVLLATDEIYDLFGTGLVFLPRESSRTQPLCDDICEVVITYGVSGNPPAPGNDPSDVLVGQTELEIAGGTHHITKSLETVTKKNGNLFEDAPNFDGLIGVNGDNVQGVDIYVPSMTLRETRVLLATEIDRAYISTLYNLAAKVNDAPFMGFERGELLFIGASLRGRKGSGDWEITYSFLASPNTTLHFDSVDLPIGDVEKEGWHLFWILDVAKEDTEANAMVRRPGALYVERVYEYGDFELLRGLP